MKYTPFIQGHSSQVRLEPQWNIDFDVFVERLSSDDMLFDSGREHAVWYSVDEINEQVLLNYHPYENAIIASVPFGVCSATKLKNLIEKPMALAFQASYKFTYEYELNVHPLFDFSDLMGILDVELSEINSDNMMFGTFEVDDVQVKWFSDNVLQGNGGNNDFSRKVVVALCERVNQSVRTILGRPNDVFQSPGLPYDWSLPLLHHYDERVLDMLVPVYRDMGADVTSHPEIVEQAFEVHDFETDVLAELYVSHAHLDMLHVLLYMLRSVMTEENRKAFYDAHIDEEESLFGHVIPFVIPNNRVSSDEEITFRMFTEACDVIMFSYNELREDLNYVEELVFKYNHSEAIETVEKGDVWTYYAPDDGDVLFAVQVLGRGPVDGAEDVSFTVLYGRILWKEEVYGRNSSNLPVEAEFIIEPHLLGEKIHTNTNINAKQSELAQLYHYDLE